MVIGANMALAEAPARATETASSALAPLENFRDCEHCPEMIVMPTGAFMMGAIPGESCNPFDIYGPVDAKDFKPRVRGSDEINIIPNEHPGHRVEMDLPYAIARNEITHAEWIACVEDGGCTHVPDHRVLTPGGYRDLGPRHPVVNVSYIDALEYVAWLNLQVGAEVYRLPTEAEWEYAARAGTETPFAQGDELTSDQANFSRRATENLLGTPMSNLVDREIPVPVDELDAANAWDINAKKTYCIYLGSKGPSHCDAARRTECNFVTRHPNGEQWPSCGKTANTLLARTTSGQWTSCMISWRLVARPGF